MKVGVSATGDSAVRAAHSLAAHPAIDSLVILGPGSSRFYEVVTDPRQCDLLVVSGPEGPARYASSGVPMVWDGQEPEEGVRVWGASPAGLALALASRESDATTASLAYPDIPESRDERVRFPDPVGVTGVAELEMSGRTLWGGRSGSDYAAVLASGESRRVAIVDEAAFMAGVTLAAGALVAGDEPRPVWADALAYLTAAAELGLVMAEVAPLPS